MNSIISPWVFYWIGVLDTFKGVTLIIAVITVIGVIVMGLWMGLDISFDNGVDSNMAKLWIKLAIVSFVASMICAVLPSESTCYKMLAANMFTEKNVTAATEYVTDVIDYAVDKVKELNPTAENERS
jgi:hypothetical protein|nr:MAG TPA: hypothetical protein [Caudoviricetes sp.]